MSRVVNLSLAVLFVSVELASAQQATSGDTKAAVPGKISKLSELPPLPNAQRKAGQAKTSGLWPPNPYQPSRSEIEAISRAQEQAAIRAARQVSPSLVDLSDGRPAPPVELRIIVDPQLDARSKHIFPRAALDADQEALRMQWIVDHEQQATANEINRTKPLQFPVSGR
jgi:hypothetical protein